MSRFRDFIRGTLVCVIKDAAPERFMNLCRGRNIFLANIRESPGVVEFVVGAGDYRKLRPVVKKCHIVPHIKARRGLPFILHKNRRHSVFFAGILLAAALLFILSGFIWNIEIEGNYTNTDENLIHFMKELGVHTGQRKSRVDTAAIEEELRLAYGNISWVSARIEGTVLKIELKEGKVLEPKADEALYGNIVAAQDAVVTSIVTRTGTARVKEGDTVRAGDILIEGIVDIYNDDAAVKTTHSVRGDGDVYGAVVEHCEDYYPAWKLVKNYTGDQKYCIGLELFGTMFTFGDASFETQSYEETTQVTKYRLTPNFYLPFSLHRTTGKAYEPERINYSEEEIQILGGMAIENKLARLKAQGAQITQYDLRTEIVGDNYVICGDIYMVIPIGEFRLSGNEPGILNDITDNVNDNTE